MALCFRIVWRSFNNNLFTNLMVIIIGQGWSSHHPFRSFYSWLDLISELSLFTQKPVLSAGEKCIKGVLCCTEQRGEPRCWSIFTASAERKGGRARVDDLEGVQRQGPCLVDLHRLPQGDTATAYLFLHFYFFFILFHSTAFISLSSQFRRTSTPALFPTSAGPLYYLLTSNFLTVEMLLLLSFFSSSKYLSLAGL